MKNLDRNHGATEKMRKKSEKGTILPPPPFFSLSHKEEREKGHNPPCEVYTGHS
jgi:hypothetical protein